MSVDGLRAWIGEVERKLGMRTRVFLVLAVIAIGAAGAAIYLAIDTRDNAVSERTCRPFRSSWKGRCDQVGATRRRDHAPPTSPGVRSPGQIAAGTGQSADAEGKRGSESKK